MNSGRNLTPKKLNGNHIHSRNVQKFTPSTEEKNNYNEDEIINVFQLYIYGRETRYTGGVDARCCYQVAPLIT